MTKYEAIFEGLQDILSDGLITLERAEELNDNIFEQYSDEELDGFTDYNIAVEALQDAVDCGDITLEEANELNTLAYEFSVLLEDADSEDETEITLEEAMNSIEEYLEATAEELKATGTQITKKELFHTLNPKKKKAAKKSLDNAANRYDYQTGQTDYDKKMIKKGYSATVNANANANLNTGDTADKVEKANRAGFNIDKKKKKDVKDFYQKNRSQLDKLDNTINKYEGKKLRRKLYTAFKKKDITAAQNEKDKINQKADNIRNSADKKKEIAQRRLAEGKTLPKSMSYTKTQKNLQLDNKGFFAKKKAVKKETEKNSQINDAIGNGLAKSAYQKAEKSVKESVDELKLKVYESYHSGLITESEKNELLEYLNLDNYTTE